MRDSPSPRSASISARWLIDLSPGNAISPRSLEACATDAAVPSASGSASTMNVARVAAEDLGVIHVAKLLVDRDEGCHEPGELAEVKLLLGVGQSGVRVRGDLDHHAVGADRDPAPGKRRDEPALPGGEGRASHHR